MAIDFANPRLSKKLRKAAQPLLKFRQVTRPVDGYGKNQGDTIDMDKLSNVQTKGGQIGENQKLPETKFLVRKVQLTVAEYGNSIPYTGKLEALSEFNVANPVQTALRNDMAKVMDSAVSTVAKTTLVKYTPTGVKAGTFNSNSSTGASIGANLTVFHIKEIVDRAVQDLVPPYSGGPDGDYLMIAHQTALRSIFDDPEFQEWNKYTDSSHLMTGEVGRVYRTRIIMANYTGLSVLQSKLGECIFFGDDSIAEGIAIPEEVRAAIPDDFGRSKKIGWYALLGFKSLWDPNTDLNADLPSGGEWRICHITGTA